SAWSASRRNLVNSPGESGPRRRPEIGVLPFPLPLAAVVICPAKAARPRPNEPMAGPKELAARNTACGFVTRKPTGRKLPWGADEQHGACRLSLSRSHSLGI